MIIGTWTGGSGGANLVITLNASSNATSTTALINNLTYTNTDTDNPTTANRNIRVVLTDGDGGTSANNNTTMTVAAVNDAPVNSLPANVFTGLNTASTFSTASGNALQISDVDAASGTIQFTLTAANGSLTLASATGLTLTGGANGSSTFTYSERSRPSTPRWVRA